MAFGTNKNIAPVLLGMALVLAALFALASCSPKIPPGSTTYELESIDPNTVGVSLDSISNFYISLDASDNTYVAQFKARGMPIFVTEEGTYEIKGTSITFSKNEGSEALIAEGLSYNSGNDTLTVACLKRNSTDTYTAVFKRNDDLVQAE